MVIEPMIMTLLTTFDLSTAYLQHNS